MNLLSFRLTTDAGLQIDIASGLVLVLLVILIGLVYYRRRQFFGKTSYFEVNEAEIGIGSGKLKLKANIDDIQIGFKFWTELTTRKIGLPLDEEHDVIVEVYDSWYAFFDIAREMIKSIPVSKIQSSETSKELVLISIHILNKELRPHLTRWQARYRRWWNSAIEDPANKDMAPQELQRKYPEYEKLMTDMKAVNLKLVVYANHLRKLIDI
jgi:hypothetical protein